MLRRLHNAGQLPSSCDLPAQCNLTQRRSVTKTVAGISLGNSGTHTLKVPNLPCGLSFVWITKETFVKFQILEKCEVKNYYT